MYIKMTIYNVVINSNNFVGGTNSSDRSYYFDWSILEDGEYELTLNFNAEGSSIHKVIAITTPDLGVTNNVFTTTSLTSARFNNVIGVLHPEDKTADTHYVCDTVCNPPVYLKSRPYGNNFTIYLYDTDGNLTDIGVDYILIMSFKKI